MPRELIFGLIALLSVACSADSSTHSKPTRTLALAPDGGVGAEPCDWFVYWLTMMDREKPCNWGMLSKDPTVALFRTNGGECLAPATICGLPACADVTYVREKQVIEVWGPAGLDAGDVWAQTESFSCEGEL